MMKTRWDTAMHPYFSPALFEGIQKLTCFLYGRLSLQNPLIDVALIMKELPSLLD